MNERNDELMLQKCVDGELSPAERAAFLRKLEERRSLDQWRTLALSFVENQILEKAFDLPPRTQDIPKVLPAKSPAVGRRQIQPWMSVAASLMVGAIVGVGGHFWLRDQAPNLPMQAQANPTGTSTPVEMVSNSGNSAPIIAQSPRSQEGSSGPRVGGSTGGAPVPVMNVNLGGHSNASEPVQVPVYSPEQWKALQRNGKLTNIPEDVQRTLESEGYILDRNHHWYRARLDDGREILVPVETVRVRPSIQ